ncbi:MAG: PAS domain-containing protein [Proteobacteria bacterium]|nr:PAS domain-containing protein [Pseudomonadota bacterium]
MRKGFATLFRDLAVVVVALAALVGFTGRSDWPLLVVAVAAALSALGFIVLRHHEPQEQKPVPLAPLPTDADEAAGAPLNPTRALLNALPDPVLVLDAQRGISLANLAARDLLGAEIEGTSLLAVLRQPALLMALDAMSRGEVPEPLEMPDIAGHAMVAELQPIDLAGAEIGRTLIVFHDVSHLRRAESLRSDFIANVSHELKTPLATLIGFLETLKGPARNDEQARARFLDIMLTEAQRMSRIVADLLSLSRIELNEHQSPEGEADLKRLLASVVDGLTLKAEARGIVIRTPDPSRLPRVPGDADELTQVVQNLVDNALKYCRDQAVVTVSAEIITDPALLRLHLPYPKGVKAAVALSVNDQGPGIAREHIPRLTERFYRVDTARSRDLGGTGLGLAIVKHIVNRHRGKLEIQSVLGQGSTFTIYLPMDSAPAKAA